MRLILLLDSHQQYRAFLQDFYPHFSKAMAEDWFVPVIQESDLDSLMGLHRGSPYITVGGTERMRAFCSGRGFHQMMFVRGGV